MDFYAGGDLADMIEAKAEGVGFSGREQATVLQEIAMALSHMHQNKFIHMDVKPQNVLFDHGGRTILADLGISVKSGEDVRGEGFGTPCYMAPEVERFELIDAKADMYAYAKVCINLALSSHEITVPTGGLSPPWLQKLHDATCSADPTSRKSSDYCVRWLSDVKKMEAQNVSVMDLTPCQDDMNNADTITISGAMRVGGAAEIIDDGRAAQKRIKESRKGGQQPQQEDLKIRSRLRKARQKAKKAIPDDAVDSPASPA